MSVERMQEITKHLEKFCGMNDITFDDLDAWFVSVTSAKYRIGKRTFKEYKEAILKNLDALERIWMGG